MNSHSICKVCHRLREVNQVRVCVKCEEDLRKQEKPPAHRARFTLVAQDVPRPPEGYFVDPVAEHRQMFDGKSAAEIGELLEGNGKIRHLRDDEIAAGAALAVTLPDELDGSGLCMALHSERPFASASGAETPPPAVQEMLEREIAAIDEGDDHGVTLEEIEARHRELEKLEAQSGRPDDAPPAPAEVPAVDAPHPADDAPPAPAEVPAVDAPAPADNPPRPRRAPGEKARRPHSRTRPKATVPAKVPEIEPESERPVEVEPGNDAGHSSESASQPSSLTTR